MNCNQCKETLNSNPVKYNLLLFCDQVCAFDYRKEQKFKEDESENKVESEKKPKTNKYQTQRIDLGEYELIIRKKIENKSEYMRTYYLKNKEKFLKRKYK